MLLNRNCITSCPSGFYPKLVSSEFTCERCHSSCYECSGLLSNQCTSCLAIPTELSFHNSMCLSICPTGFFKHVPSTPPISSFISNSVCRPCHPRCVGCSGPLINNCTNCPFAEVLYQGYCIKKCLGNQYYDRVQGICRDCDSNCKGCVDKAFGCTHCPNGYTLTDKVTDLPITTPMPLF